jgi:hypothetical protein
LRGADWEDLKRRGEGGGGGDEGGYRSRRTSEDVTISAFQSIRGKILTSSFGFSSMVSWTSSASLGCKGKDWLEDLQAFTAQVRKLRVRIFIFVVVVNVVR